MVVCISLEGNFTICVVATVNKVNILDSRRIKFIKMALVSENCTVRTISNLGRYVSHSIIGANFKHLNRKYCMDESNVYCKLKHVCVNNEEFIRICMQVKELINIRDRCMNGIFKRGECNDIIEFLCTD